MILDELENDFLKRERRIGHPLVIIPMQIPEEDVRALSPRLQAQGVSLSEHIRKLIREDVLAGSRLLTRQ